MRNHNPTPPWRSSLGVLRALAFIQPPRLLRPLAASIRAPECSTMFHPRIRAKQTHVPTWHTPALLFPGYLATWLLGVLPRPSPRQTPPTRAEQ